MLKAVVADRDEQAQKRSRQKKLGQSKPGTGTGPGIVAQELKNPSSVA